MTRRARIITAVVLFVTAAASLAFAVSLVQVAGGSHTAGVYSRVPDWSTNALTVVLGLGAVAVAAVAGGVMLLLGRRRASA